jgi:hypothetical protein
MTSAWREAPDRDDRAEGESFGPDENQLEMFETAPIGADTRLPRTVDVAHGSNGREGRGRQRTDVMVSDVSRLRFLDLDGTDPDELRRLEDSIRWLMNESNVRQLPRAATLPPVRGLPPVEVNAGADSLILNPDRLFPPRSLNRRGGAMRGVAKFLLASAVAAPTAYFIANWLQRVDMAAPSDTATLVGSFEERIASVVPSTPKRPPSERFRVVDEGSGAPQTEPVATRAIPPLNAKSAAPVEAKSATAAEPIVVEASVAPEQSPGVSAVPSDPAPGSAPAASSPPASAAPPKPALSAQEIADLVERGRILFESGDVAAARLFFRRAASAGDAAAALAMGATYDPDVLAKRFVRGIGADLEEARTWYEKARELGSPEGPRRLETLLAHR